MHLSGVNSINWGRIVAQIVYYFTAAVSLGAPHRPVSFIVPTGNFGDIFAGYAAKRMGLPIANLVIATNSNDILARTLETGRYETGAVQPTISPSMDIQVSSNFERLLFEALGRDAPALKRLMNSLQQSGSFTVPGQGARDHPRRLCRRPRRRGRDHGDHRQGARGGGLSARSAHGRRRRRGATGSSSALRRWSPWPPPIPPSSRPP